MENNRIQDKTRWHNVKKIEINVIHAGLVRKTFLTQHNKKRHNIIQHNTQWNCLVHCNETQCNKTWLVMIINQKILCQVQHDVCRHTYTLLHKVNLYSIIQHPRIKNVCESWNRPPVDMETEILSVSLFWSLWTIHQSEEQCLSVAAKLWCLPATADLRVHILPLS